MNQIWRNTDPEASERAGREKTATTRISDQDRLCKLVARSPGHTALEYAQIFIDNGFDWYRAYQLCNKRMSDLHADKRVGVLGERLCSVSKTRARTWMAIT